MKNVIHLLLVFVVLTPFSAFSDEGMWLFNAPPKKSLQEKYNFEATDAWLEHVRLSSVRFNDGGSGSIISSDGLVLTNHHVASDTLDELSTVGNNLLAKGYLADPANGKPELKSPGLTLEQLRVQQNVTDRVLKAIEGLSGEEAAKALKKVTGDLEDECKTLHGGLRGQLVKLFNGAQYDLYCYKEFADVRLVFAPEKDIAFFGGDPDNFEFPRYDLDMAIFRIYENGKAAPQEHFLKWNTDGAKDGDLVFVSGHPGSTQRMFPTHALQYLRDYELPFLLNWLKRFEVALQQFRQESPESRRRADGTYFSIQNSRKAFQGQIEGLRNPEFIWSKQRLENELRAAAETKPELKPYAGAWDKIAALYDARKKGNLYKRYALLEGRRAGAAPMALSSELVFFARHLVRLADEDLKPNGERLGEYQDAGRGELLSSLEGDVPIYADFEIAKLSDSLGFLVEQLGQDDPIVQKILGGKDPIRRARELVESTLIHRADIRKYLLANGDAKLRKARIQKSKDPLIAFYRDVLDAPARKIRKTFEETIMIPQNKAYGEIRAVTAAVQGTNTYPDATFTLRLAYGEVKGLQEATGWVKPHTTIGGAFEHEANHEAKDPWKLPESWHANKDALNPDSPLNFICTADIIGGNSGSPVVDRNGDLVGLIFDGNIQSLTSNYEYNETHRAVSVHAATMMEALRKIYGAGALADSIGK